MKLLKFVIRQINGLFPFFYPLLHIFKRFNFVRGIAAYYSDMRSYKGKDARIKSQFPLRFVNAYPIYYDRYEEAGEVPKHYFYQDLWAAKKLFQSGVKVHYDIGSRLDGFISHCLVFAKVIMLDIRPLNSKIPNLEFIKADGMNMKNIKTNSIDSISSLHAVEHFGLGRYGDPIDPLGYKKVIDEIIRVVKKGGNIYFSVPIGLQRLEFNAHRVFNPLYVLELFKGCKLVEFSVVDDKDHFFDNVLPKSYVNSNYSCGMFHFKKIK